VSAAATCRGCGGGELAPFLDLGSAPPSNRYLTERSLGEPEPWLPLRVVLCAACGFAQTVDAPQPESLFDGNYVYLSGCSQSWRTHVEAYAAAVAARYDLGPDCFAIEIAANDGTLLERLHARGWDTLGIEPTAVPAALARGRGLAVIERFFDVELAREIVREHGRAHLVVANNVLAHVPDPYAFACGVRELLLPAGVATFEFPHLLNLVEGLQFDTVYHEHYAYLNLGAVRRLFERAGLVVFDVETLSTHGGSLRVHAGRADGLPRAIDAAVARQIVAEDASVWLRPGSAAKFQTRVEGVKDVFLAALLHAKASGQRVAAYGAAAKGNTLLNFAGVRTDLLRMVADRNPEKVGKWLPGSRIPIVDEAALHRFEPDLVVLLPWNLRDELEQQLAGVRAWGGRLAVAVPTWTVLS